MKPINERLQRMQEEQAARQEDLERGRIRIERAAQEKRPTESQQQTKKKAAAG